MQQLGNSVSLVFHAVVIHDFLKLLPDTTRDLKLPKKMSSDGQKGFSYKGVRMWNNLLAVSKLTPTDSSFKSLCCMMDEIRAKTKTCFPIS